MGNRGAETVARALRRDAQHARNEDARHGQGQSGRYGRHARHGREVSDMTQPPPTLNRRGGFNISRWSIDHPYTVIAFYAAMLVLAVIAIAQYMPRRFMPYVQSPMIGVVSMMPGFSAQEM